jgi:hypothetical protein
MNVTATAPSPPSPARADGPGNGRRRPARADVRARRVPFAVLVVGLLLAGLWALLALNTAAAAAEVQARQITSDNANRLDEVEQLQIDINAKQAPGVLASAAAKLGMVPDTSPVFLSIRPDGSVVVLGTPSPVSGPAATPATTTPPATTPPAATTPATTAAPPAIAPAATPPATTTPATTPPIATPIPGASQLPGGIR